MTKLLPSARTAALAAALGAVAATFAVGTPGAYAADHRDGPLVQMSGNIAADINDVYAFMAGSRVVLAMTVFPAADVNSDFSDSHVYVIHTARHASFGGNAASTTDVLCTFDAAQTIECWIGDDEYVTGDASGEDGITSDSGRVTVFAGLRTDPFYFYLAGFNTARQTVQAAFATLPGINPNGCPIIDADTGAFLRNQLVSPNQVGDFFATLNTLAIVVEADADVFTDATNQIFSVYGSTHVKN